LSPADFFFGRTLGEGAYARVVHAKSKPGIGNHTPQHYAVKILEKRHIKRENKIKYVMMEKQLLSKLSCDLIVKLTVSFQDEEYLYMMMDLCTGGELLGVVRYYRDYARRRAASSGDSSAILSEADDCKACPLEVTRYYIASVVCALQHIHSRNIIHRDLKPENVLLMETGKIKLGDFGTAIDLTDSSEKHNSFVGTAEYVSPEVLNNLPATASVDLWAIGCMAFQMAVGKPPFQSETEYGMFMSITNHANGTEPLLMPPSLNANVSAFTSELLVEDPGARLGASDGVNVIGSEYTSIRTHPLFANFDWASLDAGTMQPPYEPPTPTWLHDESLMIDGAEDLDAYFLEGDATPIEVMPSIPKQAAGVVGLPENNADSRSTANSSGRGSIDDVTWRKFLQDALPTEEIVKTGKISKRKGFFSKTRQLILTDLPRLVYVDPLAMELKGAIPWTAAHPVRLKKLSATKFDIISVDEGAEGRNRERAYHLTAIGEGACDEWISTIQRVLDGNN
jgi:3-phosphoinositide dependent protein kinase-1